MSWAHVGALEVNRGCALKIAIVGPGYVGLSNAVILAQHHKVLAVDIDRARVEMVNRAALTYRGCRARGLPAAKPLELTATVESRDAFRGAPFVIIATPTDYDEQTTASTPRRSRR